MIAKRKDAIRIVENGKQRMLRDDYTGKIETVNGEFLKMLVNSGLTPVISPLAMSPDGIALNVDADRAAAMVAGAVGADELIILTNVPGLMSKFPDESTVIPHIAKSGLEAGAFTRGRSHEKESSGRQRSPQPGCIKNCVCGWPRGTSIAKCPCRVLEL